MMKKVPKKLPPLAENMQADADELRKVRRPRRCECGGKLRYSDGPGDYIGSWCERCTPKVTVRVPGLFASHKRRK